MKILSHLMIVFLFGCYLYSHDSIALTFKKDGSVVQKSGKVEAEAYSIRFASELKNPTKDWSKSSGRPKPVKGYFGDDIFIPGTPLLRIQGIQKGEEYLEAVYRLNGFSGKKSLYRYIIANSTPEFIEEMGLTEAQAQSYLDVAVKEMLAGADIRNKKLAKSLKSVQASLESQSSEIEAVIADQVSETIERQMAEAVSEAVEEAVEAAIDNWLDALIEKYDINPEAIIEIGDGWVSIDCSKTEC